MTFHDAKINVDNILSHPWLTLARLGVVPHLASLVRLTPSLEKTLLFDLLEGGRTPGSTKRRPPRVGR